MLVDIYLFPKEFRRDVEPPAAATSAPASTPAATPALEATTVAVDPNPSDVKGETIHSEVELLPEPGVSTEVAKPKPLDQLELGLDTQITAPAPTTARFVDPPFVCVIVLRCLIAMRCPVDTFRTLSYFTSPPRPQHLFGISTPTKRTLALRLR